MTHFKLIKQTDMMSCGPTCLAMISQHYGRHFRQDFIETLCAIGKHGVSLFNLSQAAEKLGFRTLGVKLTTKQLAEHGDKPCILHWDDQHFVVAYKTKKNTFSIADPQYGKSRINQQQLEQHWVKNQDRQGFALLLEPTDHFYTADSETAEESVAAQPLGIWAKLKQHKKLLIQLVIGVLAITLINLIIPFLSQSLIDQGVALKDHKFIYLILIAQLVFIISRTSIEFIRSWILLHISTRINISILADFLLKMMRLSLSYFDRKNTGDILQRIADHERIEQLLTSHSLNTFFSLINLLVFGVVLWIYSGQIFLAFVIGSTLSLTWPLLFLHRRKHLDNEKFVHASKHQNHMLHIIHGMPEIKINQAETKKKWQWEKIQVNLFNIKSRLLMLEQGQQAGTILINEIKNIVIIFFSAQLVISGDITLGMLVAISFILGQLNAPIDQLLSFIPILQDAKLSFRRLTEIQNEPDESTQNPYQVKQLTGDISISNLTFAYPGFSPVLKDITLRIPAQKTTAIVGESGSGKTTLLKLLLKFYAPDSGVIEYGGMDVEHLPAELIRNQSGVVFQDGHVFDDTIAANVALSGATIDQQKLMHALTMANLLDDINKLPLKWQTVIGQNGQINLSKGQQQRLMIARSIYQDPAYLFYDEATSALDANNEKMIQNNLDVFVKNRTAVIIAHRLSTVRNADQIVVLKHGAVVESGNHDTLISQRGDYYYLVKNQLELGT
ncbi:peptidase domain-containing ABC transporter [Marinicella sediminis]|uniref:Peptidase domain-containing ABC transporter n=1 Tax=Marinicella sediminis TaxID=1792834 RepID=A0ABV7J742_9GAMM|nr:peptidase domain-containing ABC transporter [Marinicella sediminis]